MARGFTANTWLEDAPSTLIVRPLPSIVRVFWIAGRLLPSLIVPLTLKMMVSVPVPHGTGAIGGREILLLALLIAARRLHSVEVPGSAMVLTLIVLVRIGVGDGVGVLIGVRVGVRVRVRVIIHTEV